jgi:hypothetical protein
VKYKKTPVNSFSDPKGEVSKLKGSLKKRVDKIFHLDSHEITADGRTTEILISPKILIRPENR